MTRPGALTPDLASVVIESDHGDATDKFNIWADLEDVRIPAATACAMYPVTVGSVTTMGLLAPYAFSRATIPAAVALPINALNSADVNRAKNWNTGILVGTGGAGA